MPCRIAESGYGVSVRVGGRCEHSSPIEKFHQLTLRVKDLRALRLQRLGLVRVRVFGFQR